MSTKCGVVDKSGQRTCERERECVARTCKKSKPLPNQKDKTVAVKERKVNRNGEEGQ